MYFIAHKPSNEILFAEILLRMDWPGIGCMVDACILLSSLLL